MGFQLKLANAVLKSRMFFFPCRETRKEKKGQRRIYEGKEPGRLETLSVLVFISSSAYNACSHADAFLE